ncbi:hypothetical protein DL89DRAFT_265228 [Linderina pennispora]|uniref:G-protein coupled receptors family 3 profile domain-containing protein n=1 Tax=Linderina pennispora TaxID=61395 RepID=A0A1Y1WHY6_9FUNG|nr:uncharacterized protein DL89DRAFT_265228 [Linderina pennispora]ORX73072.1 hypothetical protein DL89DRAFT_265228 [Linderina pennispora]
MSSLAPMPTSVAAPVAAPVSLPTPREIYVYAYANRSYLPLKAKNIPLMIYTFISSVLWYFGDIYTFFTLPKYNRVTCVAANSWLRMCLGGYLWMSLFQARLYQYISIFIWKQRVKGKYFWYPMIYMVSIPLVYGIVSIALPEENGIRYVPERKGCDGSMNLFYMSISFCFLQMLAFIFVLFYSRHINTCFSEYRQVVWCFIVACVCLIIGIATAWIPLTPERIFIFGALNTMLPILVAQVYFFVILGPPVFHCMFNRQKHLSYFAQRLRESNMTREYQLAHDTSMKLSNSYDRGNPANYTAEGMTAIGGFYRGNLESSAAGGTAYMGIHSTPSLDRMGNQNRYILD